MAAEFETKILTRRTVGKWDVVVGDVVEKMDFILVEEEGGGNRVDGRISPAFIEETAISVERIEEINVCL